MESFERELAIRTYIRPLGKRLERFVSIAIGLISDPKETELTPASFDL